MRMEMRELDAFGVTELLPVGPQNVGGALEPEAIGRTMRRAAANDTAQRPLEPPPLISRGFPRMLGVQRNLVMRISSDQWQPISLGVATPPIPRRASVTRSVTGQRRADSVCAECA